LGKGKEQTQRVPPGVGVGYGNRQAIKHAQRLRPLTRSDYRKDTEELAICDRGLEIRVLSLLQSVLAVATKINRGR